MPGRKVKRSGKDGRPVGLVSRGGSNVSGKAVFYNNVDKQKGKNGCWVWTGGRWFRHNDKLRHPSRVCWEFETGEEPLWGLQKKCATKNCVRPDHQELQMTTREAAVLDRKRKVERESFKLKFNRAASREIGDIPGVANKKRRDRCRHDLKVFCETYLPEVFSLDWSAAQLTFLEDLQRVIMKGGKKARAMPRGEGKTACAQAAVHWAICFGHRRYIYFISDEQGSAEDGLKSIRMAWEINKLLLEDFPEIGYPISFMDSSPGKARMQTYGGDLTYSMWSSDELNFPCLRGFDYGRDYNAGIVLKTSGIIGGIRGATHTHPLTGELIRPDLIVLDDVQTDRVARSPTSVRQLEAIIDGAIRGMAGPSRGLACIMACTVIAQGDVSDIYLSPERKPDWLGERTSMVKSWPPGVSDGDVSDGTPAGKAWLRYAGLRRESLRLYRDIHLATEFYSRNRGLMDSGFEVSWPQRFLGSDSHEGNKELSAQQHAMNLRLENEYTFAAEYMNRPRQPDLGGSSVITVEGILDRVTAQNRNEITPDTICVVSMVDVQEEMLWFMTMALEPDFSGCIIDYGVYPDYRQVIGYYATKREMAKYNMLSREFFKAYPQVSADKASLEAKIAFGLRKLCGDLLSRRFVKQVGTEFAEVPMTLVAIDSRWGDVTPTIRRFVRENGDSRLVPYMGVGVGAVNIQFAEMKPREGELFEYQKHEGIEQCMWYAKPISGTYHLFADANAAKTMLSNRLSSPAGSRGAITIFNGTVAEHEMLADHLAGSEYPEPVYARGRRKDEWKTKAGKPDNDLFDCAAACIVLGSYCGCRLSMPRQSVVAALPAKGAPKMSEILEQKRVRKQQALQRSAQQQVRSAARH